MESPMVTTKKEGYLYKWTNYLSGWQQRYFVLESDKDSLTYFRSPDEVGRGCRGAVKLSSCQLNVHPSDQCRLDLTIPSQSICYCIRAQSARDRQDWLVAFSTAKACRSRKSSSFSPTAATTNGHEHAAAVRSSDVIVSSSLPGNSGPLCNSSNNNLILNKAAKYQADDVSEDIREKAGQMRLFADLLSQQLSSLKTDFNSSLVAAPDNQHSGGGGENLEEMSAERSLVPQSAPDKERGKREECSPQSINRPKPVMDESDENVAMFKENRNLFEETCEAFLMTVNELCVMVDSKIALLGHSATVTNSVNVSKQNGSIPQMENSSFEEVQCRNAGDEVVSSQTEPPSSVSWKSSPLQKKDSTDSNVFFPPAATNSSGGSRKSRLSSSAFKSFNGSTSALDSVAVTTVNCHSRSPSLSSVHSSGSDNELHLKTFFATVTKIFQTTVSSETHELALRNVLKACAEFVLFFDVLYYTILPPIKSGIISNTKRLQMVLDDFSTIEEVLVYEQTQNLSATKHSSTQCIIWLYRDLSFMREFLTEILTGEVSLSTAAAHSYSKTLKAYNGWVVRGVYAVAFKSLPYRSDFINALCQSTDALDYCTMERCVLKDMDRFVRVLSVFLCKLQNLLLTNNILAGGSDPHYLS